MKRAILLCLIGAIITSCASSKKKFAKSVDTMLSTPFYDNQFTGFLMVDADNNDTLYQLNSTKYFTPASNVKIFTLFTALTYLPPRIPALTYVRKGNTLFVEGTGDPSFLHPHLKDSTAFKFLQQQPSVRLHLNNYKEDRYAPGWAWEDYQYSFQPERTAFPLYGNVATIYQSNGMKVLPSYFKDEVYKINYTSRRELGKNKFYIGKPSRDSLEIPFKTDTSLTKRLLEQALKEKG